MGGEEAAAVWVLVWLVIVVFGVYITVKFLETIVRWAARVWQHETTTKITEWGQAAATEAYDTDRAFEAEAAAHPTVSQCHRAADLWEKALDVAHRANTPGYGYKTRAGRLRKLAERLERSDRIEAVHANNETGVDVVA